MEPLKLCSNLIVKPCTSFVATQNHFFNCQTIQTSIDRASFRDMHSWQCQMSLPKFCHNQSTQPGLVRCATGHLSVYSAKKHFFNHPAIKISTNLASFRDMHSRQCHMSPPKVSFRSVKPARTSSTRRRPPTWFYMAQNCFLNHPTIKIT